MLYPVVFWHFEGNRVFSWFVEGDFFAFGTLTESLPFLEYFWTFFNIVYWLILIGWLIEEIYLARKHQKAFAWGKVLWTLSTACNWYLGIVYFNSDVAFSITNVVAHGIPYMALTFFYVEEKKIVPKDNLSKEERNALNNLSQRTDIIITKAGKGGAVVIWDIKDYITDLKNYATTATTLESRSVSDRTIVTLKEVPLQFTHQVFYPPP